MASVSSVSQAGQISRVTIGTRQPLGEIARPGSYTVSAYRYRKEAFVFAQSGQRWDLRHFGSLTALSRFNDPASYRVMGSGFRKLGELIAQAHR